MILLCETDPDGVDSADLAAFGPVEERRPRFAVDIRAGVLVVRPALRPEAFNPRQLRIGPDGPEARDTDQASGQPDRLSGAAQPFCLFSMGRIEISTAFSLNHDAGLETRLATDLFHLGFLGPNAEIPGMITERAFAFLAQARVGPYISPLGGVFGQSVAWKQSRGEMFYGKQHT